MITKLKIALALLLACTLNSANAQKIFSADAEYKAKVKVFVVDAEYKADLIVYKEDAEYKAKGMMANGIL